MNRIDEIKVEIAKWHKELGAIQNECPHPPLTHRYMYNSNTENWDRSDDCYWTEHHCTLCDKWWHTGESNSVKGTRVQDRSEL